MNKYIDIVLTANGMFCVAPAWVVKPGDMVGLKNVINGKEEIFDVISVCTDSEGGEYITQLEKYTGVPLPRITARYFKTEVEWDEIHE